MMTGMTWTSLIRDLNSSLASKWSSRTQTISSLVTIRALTNLRCSRQFSRIKQTKGQLEAQVPDLALQPKISMPLVNLTMRDQSMQQVSTI